MSVQEDTELVAAALRALVGRVTDPVLDELEALRVAVEVRCEAVTAALADPKELDPALHEVLDQFALAAREQAEAAAHAARIQAFEEAEIRWDFERATLEKRYEALQAEAAAAREADRIQSAALEEALQDAKVQADIIRSRAEVQLEAARVAQTQLLAETHAQIEAARTETERALATQRGLLDDTRGELEGMRGQLETARGQVETTHSQLETTHSQLDAMRGQLEETRVQLADAERAQADARQALDTARAESAKARAAEQRVLDDARAQLAEVQARFEEAQRARADASEAAENAQVQLATVRAEFAAHQASDATARATLTEALQAARAQWDSVQTDTRSHLEAAQTAHAAALADAHAERDAARTARNAAHADRDAAHADRDAAHADRDAAHADRDAARTERNAAFAERDTAFADRDAAYAARDAAHAEVSAARQTLCEAAVAPAPNPRAIAPLLDQLAGAMRTMDEAASLTHVLDALLDGVGALFPRTAIFLVKADRLQGWRRAGDDSVAADAPPDVPLTADSPLTQALSTGRVIVADHEVSADGSSPTGQDVWTATLPIAVGHRVVALLQAEDAGRREDGPTPQDRQTALTVSDLLVRHAGRCLAALTATAALPALVGATGTRADRAAGDSSADAAAPAASRTLMPRRRAGEAPSVEDARRYARLLVSEIKRYNEANLGAGPRDATLYDRLKDDIERCRRLYAGRVPAELRAASSFFDDALLEILAGGDPDTLRRLEQRLEDGPLGPPSENRAETTSSR